MEVKNGYKQTEVGVIPEDWDCILIKNLIEDGILEKPLDGNHGNIHPKSSDYVDSGIPFVMANDIQNGIIDLKNCHFIRKEQADRLQKGFSIKGDVLITHKGTIGNVAVVGEISSVYIMLTPQVTYYRVKDEERINNKYIKHYFESSQFQSILISASGGGTRAYIGITNQQKLPFILPSVKEQTAIATALSDADALIRSTEKLIAKKRAIKQGAMQELLKPQEGWMVMKLGEIAEIDPENLSNKTDPEYKFKYISLEDVNYGVLQSYTEQVFRSSPSRARRVIRKNDILVSTVRPNLKSHLYLESNVVDTVCSTGFSVIRCNEKNVIPKYIFSLFFASYINRQIDTLLTGSNYPAINSSDVKSLLIPLPSMKEQTCIATILSNMDAEISALEAKLAKYKQIKQGMMQTLLTGRIRLV